jgi:regulator of cell morphogenesis and NO signaling
MKTISAQETVGAIVTRSPRLSRVFESVGIDYCCGGHKSLQAACQDRGLRPAEVVAMLEGAANDPAAGDDIDLEGMTLAELTDHIIDTHHEYLRRELPRLAAITEKVAASHGARDRRLLQVRDVFAAMASELNSHMRKEENILFPLVRRLEAGDPPAGSRGRPLAYPIRQMESEHDDAGSSLERIEMLTKKFTPPEWACNTYRVMLDGLKSLQADLHVHIHKENGVLFPRALELEALIIHGPLVR